MTNQRYSRMVVSERIIAMRKLMVFPGQRVITTGGEIATVAFVNHGQVYVFGANGLPKVVDIVGEAWGGEHDMHVMNAA